jgi:hypothetical protein
VRYAVHVLWEWNAAEVATAYLNRVLAHVLVMFLTVVGVDTCE